MNKTLVGLVLIALLVGLGGGYALGYVIYQPQLQNLQSDLNNMGDDLDNLSNDLDNLGDKLNAFNSTLMDTQSSVATLQDQLNSLLNQLIALQNQLTSLNSKFSSLNSTVERIENRSWHKVFSISASANFTSDTFPLRGREIRVMLTAVGQDALSYITITLHFPNGALYSYYGFSGIWTATNVEEELIQPGEYYLQVVTHQTSYDLLLWDYY